MMEISGELADHIAASVAIALAEDIGAGDLTAGLIDDSARANAQIIVRESAVLCGTAWVTAVFGNLDRTVRIEWQHADGEPVTAGSTVCRLSGRARPLLTGERSALNFLQLLSGTATATRAYVEAARGTSARILDTRKTIPGLRLAQKYAVACGGGSNHRLGLFDAILIKENHIAAAGGIAPAVAAASTVPGAAMIEIEVESLAQLEQALITNIDRIMLDNFSVDDLREAVRRRDAAPAEGIELEASGGVTLDNVRTIAETGVDYISVGDVTKHVRATDFSMRFA
jgi:nicotinate-nucleotide pyrophosphorylase (carboxylating)